MVDEPITTPVADPPAEPAPIALVNADGSFSEKWIESLPEEIRGEKNILNNLGDFNGAMRQLVHAQKNVGKGKIILPDETSGDNDWNAFYDATGRPKTVDDYVFEKDETLAEHYNDDLLKSFKEGAHKVGINAKQMAFLNAFENERIKAGIETANQGILAKKQEATDAVNAKWGAASDQMLHLANLFVNENTIEGPDRDAVLEIIGNNPVIADLFAESSKKYIAEHKAISGQMTTPTPENALDEISELQGTEGYMSGELAQSNPGKHESIKRKLEELFKLAYPGD